MSGLIALTENEAWSLEQYEDYDCKEVSMTILAFPKEHKPKAVYEESLDPEQSAVIDTSEGICATAITVACPQAAARRDGPLLKIARGLVAFDNILSGPPMSRARRNRFALAEYERARASFHLMWYNRGFV